MRDARTPVAHNLVSDRSSPSPSERGAVVVHRDGDRVAENQDARSPELFRLYRLQIAVERTQHREGGFDRQEDGWWFRPTGDPEHLICEFGEPAPRVRLLLGRHR
jgi:hypothetical protein